MKDLKGESGMTLVESMMAILILLGGLLMMAQVLAVSVLASKTHGRDSGKTTVFARDKMEELTALNFANTSLTAGNYSDYLNINGTTATSSTSAAYTRQWQVSDISTTRKRITVSVASNKSFRYGAAPSATLVTEKTP